MQRRIKRWIRSLLSFCVRTWLDARSRQLTVATDDRILVVAPHPDDESLGCGGTISELVYRAQRVEVAFMTAADTTRQGEALAALRALGVGNDAVHFLGAPDGALDRLAPPQREALGQSLSATLRRANATIVFHPLRGDGSTEHEASFAILHAGLVRARYSGRLIEYPVWAHWWPWLLIAAWRRSHQAWSFALGDRLQDKRRAVDQHSSQVTGDAITGAVSTTQEFVELLCGPTEYFFESPFSAGPEQDP